LGSAELFTTQVIKKVPPGTRIIKLFTAVIKFPSVIS
jgi:hypothetical protein